MEIGNYTLINQLSGGRYGAIWKARDQRLDRDVALKQLALATPDRREGIISEVQHAGRLKHENIVNTEPPVTDDNGIWLVEEWVAGASLATLLATTQLSLRQRLGVVRGALVGLAYAHKHDVVHGSFSPRTILVDTDGTPKLVEFGAWLGHPDAAGIGAYASPEAFAGDLLAPPSDVYSAGAVIAQLLSRPDPADAEATGKLLGDLKPVLDRAMAPNVGDRHPDGQALLDDLDRSADRSMGAAWWTKEGLGAIAASSAAASVAASGAATAGGAGAIAGTGAANYGGAGAVSGSLNLQGGGAVAGGTAPGAGAGVLAGARHSAKARWIAIVAGGIAVVVAGVAAYGVNRQQDLVADPAPGGQVPAATSTSQPGGQASTPIPTPTQTPKPKPKPQQGFAGTYRYVSIVTKVVGASIAVGNKQTASWVVTTRCSASKCKSSIKPSDGGAFSLSGGLNTSERYRVDCIEVETGKKTGKKVPMQYKRTLKITERKGGMITKISGTDRYRQLKKCDRQVVPLVEVRKKITITFVRA
jgi:serine/threonine-protein kinase